MPKNKPDAAATAKALATKRPKRRDPIPTSHLLKTGSTLLDLAISGRRGGGFTKGRYFWVVGDSSSGKTWLTLTCLAEAAMNKNFDEYRLIYDNVEDGALMDMERFFGKRMATRLEAPTVDASGVSVYSQSVEDFYYNVDDALSLAEKPGGRPFIWILDSMDGLDSGYSESKFQAAKKASRTGTTAAGDYGDGKAKINSTRLRGVIPRLKATGSILIILSQTRDNVGGGMFDPKQTSAGGRALKFYATVELWSSVGSRIKRTLKGKDIVVGIYCRVKTKKNRITGRETTIEFPIFYDSGIDDIGGMVDFLTTWKFWSKNKSSMIDASPDFTDVVKRREDLIKWIEDNDLRVDMEDITELAWAEIQDQLKVGRKSKYE